MHRSTLKQLLEQVTNKCAPKDETDNNNSRILFVINKISSHIHISKQMYLIDIICNMVDIGMLSYPELILLPAKRQCHKSIFAGICAIIYREGFFIQPLTKSGKFTEKKAYNFFRNLFEANTSIDEYSRNKDNNIKLAYSKLIAFELIEIERNRNKYKYR